MRIEEGQGKEDKMKEKMDHLSLCIRLCSKTKNKLADLDGDVCYTISSFEYYLSKLLR